MISSMVQCMTASQADATPALYVGIEPVDASHSKFVDNDRLAYQLNPKMFHCADGGYQL